MSRKRCRRRVIVPLPPRGLRPKLAADQVRDLGLVHIVNLDTIRRGEGDEALLWQWVGGVLTWCKVAEMANVGQAEMAAQTALVTRLVERYGATGRVEFSCEDDTEYELAVTGVDVMDQLAELVDRPTAVIAAEWSEARVQAMADQCVRKTHSAQQQERKAA